MAHALEIRADGTAAFAAFREPGWHKLGITLTEEVTDIEQATLLAQMRYRMSMQPVYVVNPNAATAADPDSLLPVYGDRQAVLRENIDTGDLRAFGGSLTGRYKIHSLEDAWRWVNDLLPHGCTFETIGNLKGGAVAFLCVRLPQTALKGTEDETAMYLTVSTSYDGSSATRGIISGVRVVCANTLAWAEEDKKASVSVRHNTFLKADDKVKEVLGLADAKVAQVEELKTKLSFTFDRGDFAGLVTDLFPVETTILQNIIRSGYDYLSTGEKRQYTTAMIARQRVEDLWRFSPYKATGSDGWSAYQAVVEYADHYASVKGKDAEARRAEKQLMQDNSDLKVRTLELMGVTV